MKRIILILALVISFFSPVTSVAAPDEPRWMFFEVMSPFCPGRSLADCPTDQAENLRNKMLDEVKAGKKPRDVVEETIQSLGEDFRAAPKSAGFGFFAWAVPGGFVLIGLILILLWVRRTTSPTST